MAPFTLFDFQRRKSRYQFMPGKGFPRPIRIFNRILIAGLLAWACLQIGRCAFATDTPVSQSDQGNALVPTHSGSPLDDLAGHESSGTVEEESDDDTSPILPASDSVSEILAATPEPFDPTLQKDSLLGKRIDQILRQYRPSAAFYLMVDAQTNEILAWGQRADSTNQTEPTWLSKATFPAASLAKMVTSVAAIESGRYGTASTIPLIGRSTTLYSRQLRVPENYKGSYITLQDAFARSCNPSMGLIGKHLGGNTLRKYGQRLGFNRPWPHGIPQPSRFQPPDTGYGLAEVASGFTRANTISPLHSAAIVRALLMQEPLQMPWSHKISQDFAPREPMPLDHSEFQADTYYGMRQLFLRTVSHGTARKHIRRTLYAVNRESLAIGGKTGSLDGDDPPGRYDWFAGFAQSKRNPHKGVIVVVMQIHDKIRTLPSPSIAGLLINQWAKQTLEGSSKKKS